MKFTGIFAFFLAEVAIEYAAASSASGLLAYQHIAKPTLHVPHCPNTGSITYNKSVPDLDPFPETKVSLCYGKSFIHINFTALGEENFYYNSSISTNGEIYNYEVMEAFIYHGTNDPQTYLEFEVAPNNVTFQAFIYNPSKVRAAGAAFDRFYITDLADDGITAKTVLDYTANTWISDVQIPLGLLNVDKGMAKGTRWRMNFFRTITGPATFPNQTYGGWSSKMAFWKSEES
ncbi:hypothetical protein VP1G_03116 [Cytospora mali]|uniref:Carbohydrate-binding domain-containing protein n=1 Tax=Cytospora mali TaxID=578113 RepID=A0A194UVS2_CYTMA|nr:hypothetical protein VP1G_03116 [Valsa mali var. pyri (nom. inval.)]